MYTHTTCMKHFHKAVSVQFHSSKQWLALDHKKARHGNLIKHKHEPNIQTTAIFLHQHKQVHKLNIWGNMNNNSPWDKIMFLFSVTLTEYMSTEVAYKHRSGGIDKHTSPFFQQDETFLHLSLNDLKVCNAVFNCWQSPLPITYIARTSSNTHTENEATKAAEFSTGEVSRIYNNRNTGLCLISWCLQL